MTYTVLITNQEEERDTQILHVFTVYSIKFFFESRYSTLHNTLRQSVGFPKPTLDRFTSIAPCWSQVKS